MRKIFLQSSIKDSLFTGLIALVLIAKSSTFIVDERELVIKFRLGEIVTTYNEPGLYFMIPFLNNVKKYDSRLLTMDSKPEQFLTSEKKNVIVDSFVKWRISDPRNFYRSSKGDERIGVNRLSQIVNDLTKSEFSKRTVNDVVSGDRVEIMTKVTKEANQLPINTDRARSCLSCIRQLQAEISAVRSGTGRVSATARDSRKAARLTPRPALHS